ncbi:MAG: transketolase [Clostridia bacterium]|nr:transketolase [Clostridia bacterium]
MNQAETDRLNHLCRQFRKDLIEVLHERQTGHPGGSLSVCEILTVLLFEEMRVDPDHPDRVDRDRLILSKGHAAPMLYRVLAERGFFPVEELHTLRKLNSRLQGHPCLLDTPGVDMTSGPLGLGLSVGLGAAIGLQKQGLSSRVYVVLGDGELNEGTVWEAVMSASKFHPENLTTIVDYNGVQLDGPTSVIMPEGDLKAKFEAFGWQVLTCDGHIVADLYDSLQKAKTITSKPVVIIAKTVKGKGVSFMEGQNAWHGKAIDDAHYEIAISELGGTD